MTKYLTVVKAISYQSIAALLLFAAGCKDADPSETGLPKSGYVSSQPEEGEEEEKEGYDGPAKFAQFDFDRTKDPATGKVPRDQFMLAMRKTIESKNTAPFNISGFGTWTERGPISDVVGPSNGNTRANSGIASGRTRAVMVDLADADGSTVFMAGIDGGIWKTTDITVGPATWTLVNDFLSNLAISYMCQDPTDHDIMYACTGESYWNVDAVAGVGVFKSVDHGVTWTLLPSTTTYTQGTRVLCDAAGNIYLATRGTGLLRSTKASGGAVWTNITPSGLVSDIGDIEISNTGRLHVSTGIFSANGYRFTDIPSTVTSATWTSATTLYTTSGGVRTELGCSGNVLFALPSTSGYQVPTIFKSIDGGANWAPTAGQPTSGWASQQAWYALSCVIDPSNTNNVIVGGLDNYKSVTGGNSWAATSAWVGTGGQYVHADNHIAVWYDNGNKLIFGSDGGIFYSTDKGVTIRDRNAGLRIKQFYSCAMHPTQMNYFLAGAQDNGVHQFNNAGLSSTVEVTGGDGAYVAIDQDQPTYHFGSYVYSNFRRSTNNGASWASATSNNNGPFINPFAYDNIKNKVYAGYLSNQYLRWENPQTGSTTFAQTISTFNGTVGAVHVSPFGLDTVYFGSNNGRVVRVSDASTATPGNVNLTPAGMSGYISCVNTGTSSRYLVATSSSYGVSNVWISSTYGASWTAIDGNLPNMPVYWAYFVPGDNTKLIIATETGVWYTLLANGGSTVWTASASFPTVRTDMLQYRSTDGMIAAATHGRGLWTQPASTIVGLNYYVFNGTGNWNTAANWQGSVMPPAVLAPGDHVVIDPSAGQCILNVAYNLTGGAQISVMPGKSFVVQGNLTVN